MNLGNPLVSYDEHGVFELEPQMLAGVSGGWSLSASYSRNTTENHTCGTDIDQNCTKPTNGTCVDPNGVCGNDVGCTSASVGG